MNRNKNISSALYIALLSLYELFCAAAIDKTVLSIDPFLHTLFLACIYPYVFDENVYGV